MSRWDLPVPESPIRQSGWPVRTQSQAGQGVDHGGADAGVGVEVEVGQPFRAGEPGAADLPLGAAAVAVVAFGHEQFGEEPAVGELLPLGLVGGAR